MSELLSFMEAEQNQRKLISVVLRSLTDLANIGFSVLEKQLAKHRDQRQEEVAQLRNELREKQSEVEKLKEEEQETFRRLQKMIKGLEETVAKDLHNFWKKSAAGEENEDNLDQLTKVLKTALKEGQEVLNNQSLQSCTE